MPPEHSVRGEREDLDEMLGNLLDNACKWAKSRVTVTSEPGDGVIAILVDDDGPGLAPSMLQAVLQRGVSKGGAEVVTVDRARAVPYMRINSLRPSVV